MMMPFGVPLRERLKKQLSVYYRFTSVLTP